MDRPRTWAAVGITACCGLYGVLLWPYISLPPAANEAIAGYYGSGIFGITIIVALSLIYLVVFSAGLANRANESSVAGATIALGVFLVLMAFEWTIAVQTISGTTWLVYHPWIILGLVCILPISGILYARSVGIL